MQRATQEKRICQLETLLEWVKEEETALKRFGSAPLSHNQPLVVALHHILLKVYRFILSRKT